MFQIRPAHTSRIDLYIIVRSDTGEKVYGPCSYEDAQFWMAAEHQSRDRDEG